MRTGLISSSQVRVNILAIYPVRAGGRSGGSLAIILTRSHEGFDGCKGSGV